MLSTTVFSAEQKIVMDDKKYVVLQAAYLFNIAKFISWPAQQQEQPFRVCLIGEQSNSLEPLFREAFHQRLLEKRKIEVHRWANNDPMLDCQLVYFTSTPPTSLPAIATKAETLRIAAPGVLINNSVLFGLSVESGRIIINYHAAANGDFRLPINTALLRITRSVTGETR